MRTSHLSIRKRINDEKLKITDEDLFASPQFSGYLTDIAEAAAKRYKRSIQVVTYWDTTEDAELADTDNKLIRINAGNPVTQSFPSRRLRADSLVGFNGHEVGHLLFTDFKILKTYVNTLSSGAFYPEEPKVQKLSAKLQDSLNEIKQLFADQDKAAIGVIVMIAHDLINAIEDVYIESRMCDSFAGTFRTGILINNHRMFERSMSIHAQIDAGIPPVFLLTNLIKQYLLNGDINNLGNYTGEYLDVFNQCVPILDNAVCDDHVRVRYRAANQILLLLWDYIKELADKVKQDEADGKGNTEDLLQNLAEVLKGLSEAPSLPDRNSKPVPCPKKLKHEKPSDNEENADVQDAVNYETGRIALQKTSQIEDEGDGQVTHNLDYAGSGYAPQAEKDMNRILNKMAEERAVIRCEEELNEELQKEASRIRYGDAHKNVHVTVNRMVYVNDTLRNCYKTVSPPLLLISKRLQKQVSQILKDRREGGKMNHLLLGKRIDARNLIHDDGHIFYKMNLPDEEPLLAVAILIDESGSMSSNDRITRAREAAIIIYDFCRKLNIPVIVYGHTSYGEDVDLFSYGEYDSVDGNDAYRLMDMSSRGCNRDGAALRYVAERLMTRPETVKLLILVSDGQPNASGYSGTEAEADLRGIKLEYSRKGITLFAAAIGDDKENIQRIYGDGFLDITNLNELPAKLARLISGFINRAA